MSGELNVNKEVKQASLSKLELSRDAQGEREFTRTEEQAKSHPGGELRFPEAETQVAEHSVRPRAEQVWRA